MKNILVAIDLDPSTQQVVDYAVQIAKAFEAKLWLIHIAEAEPDFIGYNEGPQYIRDSFAKELRDEHKTLQSLCAEVKKAGLEAEGLMIQGPTIDMILQEAKKLNVDLIITATHHRNFIYKAFIGSVSTELFERSSIPLLAYPVGR
ncbi:MAG: universal stress protein [Flavobacteriales bacterium]|nr:universal stress protein [Flavobacteriales bacterium]